MYASSLVLMRFDYSPFYSIPTSPIRVCIAQSLYPDCTVWQHWKFAFCIFCRRKTASWSLISLIIRTCQSLISRSWWILMIPQSAAQVCLVIQWTSKQDDWSAAKHDGRWMENDGRYSIDVGSVSPWSLGRCWNLEIMCVNWFDAAS